MSIDLSHPLISVIVVNYNGKKFLRDCLDSIFCQTYNHFEVILVDNASVDGSVDYVRNQFPKVTIFTQSVNLGFAGGTNAGIRQARGEFILTLNNDTIVSPTFIEELSKPMISDLMVGICGSKMLLPDGRINSTAICISMSGAVWDRGMGEMDRGQYDSPEEVFGACAGAALYRRVMLDEIGHFDDDFFLYMEDVDLSFRARLSGWKCIYVPSARVVHTRGGTTGLQSYLSIYYVNRNVVWYVVKNFPTKLFYTSLPWIIGRNCAVIPYYFFKGNGLAALKAKVDAIRGLNSIIKKRRNIVKKIPDEEIKKWIQLKDFHPIRE